MRIDRMLVAVAAIGVLLTASSARASLVLNGDFESGPAAFATLWNPANAVLSAPADALGGVGAAAELKATVSSITQTVPIVGGNNYALDFWAKTTGAGALVVTLDSVVVDTLVFGAASVYTHYVYPLLTPTTVGDVTFVWADGAINKAFVDNITLVPESSTILAGALLLLPFGACLLRMFRRPGLV